MTVIVCGALQFAVVNTTLAGETDFSEGAYNTALESGKIGLPDYAEGNAEGYLFPATYEVKPGMKPVAILKMMVARWQEAADAAELETKAAELGHTPAELMIIASLIEAEGRGDDMPKIARVIYNRLDGQGDKGGTNGTLGIDASIAYAWLPAAAAVPGAAVQVEYFGERLPAVVAAEPLFDPEGKRMRP